MWFNWHHRCPMTMKTNVQSQPRPKSIQKKSRLKKKRSLLRAKPPASWRARRPRLVKFNTRSYHEANQMNRRLCQKKFRYLRMTLLSSKQVPLANLNAIDVVPIDVPLPIRIENKQIQANHFPIWQIIIPPMVKILIHFVIVVHVVGNNFVSIVPKSLVVSETDRSVAFSLQSSWSNLLYVLACSFVRASLLYLSIMYIGQSTVGTSSSSCSHLFVYLSLSRMKVFGCAAHTQSSLH